MNRREFIAYGAALAGGIGLPTGSLAAPGCGVCPPGAAGVAAHGFTLRIGALEVQVVDGVKLPMLGFGHAAGGKGPQVPGPVLRVREGSLVEVTIENDRPETHGFEVTGIPGSRTEVAPGCTCSVTFTAPHAGTYIYHDAFGGTPLHRLLGLHGVLVVEPLDGVTPGVGGRPGSRTPYSLESLDEGRRRVVSGLFDALGYHERFLGGEAGKWVPCGLDRDYSNQERIWVLSAVDPRLNALIQSGGIKSSGLPADLREYFEPRYFMINNRSGYDLHYATDVVCANYVGEPTLLRTVNVALTHHSPHIHGNAVFRLSQADLDPNSPRFEQVEVADNILEVDTWAMWPMDRRDVLLPYEIPPDIPYGRAGADPDPASSQFERMVRGQAQEPFPLRYPMHCHCEMSQTAAGGNYPQGMVTHWQIEGGLGGRTRASQLTRTRT